MAPKARLNPPTTASSGPATASTPLTAPAARTSCPVNSGLASVHFLISSTTPIIFSIRPVTAGAAVDITEFFNPPKEACILSIESCILAPALTCASDMTTASPLSFLNPSAPLASMGSISVPDRPKNCTAAAALCAGSGISAMAAAIVMNCSSADLPFISSSDMPRALNFFIASALPLSAPAIAICELLKATVKPSIDEPVRLAA